ncbi:MAG: nitrous oxide reductase accessory protein NosL [Ferruginibacter sp.]
MKKKLSGMTRLLLLLAAAALVFVLYLPMWRIDLDAPQYPEGLKLEIHAKGLQGNVDIINGLNHYIGMKTLHNEDFIEFTVLPFCILFFTALFAATALINKRSLLHIAFILFVVFGIVAMYDFWRWEYNYGHNLNPNAAIVVPGMAYQPPLIGFKQLLNFGAYSFPDSGGWIFIGAGAAVLFCVIIEWRRNKKNRLLFPTTILLLPVLLLGSCNAGPEAIKVGADNCSFCKMTISDAKYGGEIVTKKGKLFKFDDIHCLLEFKKGNLVEQAEIKDIYLVDFAGSHELVNAKECFLMQGGEIKSPMNGDVIAFKSNADMKPFMKSLQAKEISWNELVK